MPNKGMVPSPTSSHHYKIKEVDQQAWILWTVRAHILHGPQTHMHHNVNTFSACLLSSHANQSTSMLHALPQPDRRSLLQAVAAGGVGTVVGFLLGRGQGDASGIDANERKEIGGWLDGS